MIINGQSLLEAAPIENMIPEKRRAFGMSYGLDESGYDIRVRERVVLHPFKRFALASSLERFAMPDNLVGLPCNKSSWARKALDASITTKIEPGWHGYLTVEMVYSGWKPLVIPAGCGILSIVFHEISDRQRYAGKYQGQGAQPVAAIHEH